MAFKSLSPEEQQEFYSKEAMDRRCAMRHSREMVGILRVWARTLEAHARNRLGMQQVVSVTESMYSAAIQRASLALSRIPSRDELMASAKKDWNNDSKGHATMSFERFKDAIFQLADTWVDSMEIVDYVAFLDLLLKCCSSKDGSSFLDASEITRGAARPEGYDEDPDFVKMREKREEMERARERREAALLLQRQQRVRQQQKAARERVIYEQELLARAAKRREAEEARKLHEAELERALRAAAAAGASGLAEQARAARALELKVMAEQSSLRMRMRTLGLLPAITYTNDTSRKIHVEDRSFDEAKGWIEDADEVDAWSRNATKSLLATSAAQNETQEQTRLRHELQQAGVYPVHARGILKRAAMNQAMLQNVPQQALPNSPRLPRLASPRGINEKAPFRVGVPHDAQQSPRRRYFGAGFAIAPPLKLNSGMPAEQLGATHGAAYAWDTFFDAAGAQGVSPRAIEPGIHIASTM